MRGKAFEIARNPRYDGYQRGLDSVVYKFFDKKSTESGIKTEINQNQQLANELYKPIIRKLKTRKVYFWFKDNIWNIALDVMQLISKYNEGIRILLCAIDLLSNYELVVPSKDKKGVSIVNAFEKI